MQLTSCQETAIKEFRSFINNPSEKEFILTGMGGVGKTYLIKYLIEETDKANEVNTLLELPEVIKNKAYSATTHKAANILSDAINDNVLTLHSLLALSRGFDKDTGNPYFFKPRNKSVNFEDFTLIFIEESSMVNRALLKITLDNMYNNCRIVWLGDAIQLPPVGESSSPVFDRDLRTVDMVTPVRFDNIELIQLNMELRQAVIEQRLPKIVQGNHVRLVDRSTFHSLIIEANKQKMDCKVVSWTNAKTAFYSKLIHHEIFGDVKFNIGQKLIAKSRITSVGKVINNQAEMVITGIPVEEIKPFFNTSAEFTKIETKLTTIQGELNLLKWMSGFVLVFCMAILVKLLL